MTPIFHSKGPCCPSAVNVTQVTQAMTNVTWSSSSGARSFVAHLMSPRGEAKCHTLDTNCLMGCITCGTNYSVNLDAISATGLKSQCAYSGFSSSEDKDTHRFLTFVQSRDNVCPSVASGRVQGHVLMDRINKNLNATPVSFASGACCPTGVKLYRWTNNSLRVYWRSLGPQACKHIVEVYGTGANYTCNATAGTTYCDIQEGTCGDVYTVVVAPVGQNGLKVNFCLPRKYSGRLSG